MSQSAVPVWVPLTDYTTYARVTPTVPDGTNWWTLADGTSGATEPTWPTVAPWTVSDGSLTWQKASSWRQQVSTGLLTALQDFRDANPSLLKGIRTARPNSMTGMDLPGVFIDGGNETVRHSQSTRWRDLLTTVTAVTFVPDNAEAQTGMDALIDGLMDLFTSSYHSASGFGIVEEDGVQQVDLDEGTNIHYLGYRFTFANTTQEGRT